MIINHFIHFDSTSLCTQIRTHIPLFPLVFVLARDTLHILPLTKTTYFFLLF